jgi:cytochrome c oxidase assembly factor CtaG
MGRITPLGLTPQEAKAWYWRNVLMPAVRRGSIASTIASIMIVAMYTPIGAFLETTLAAHMVVQHFVFILAGFIYAYGIGLTLLVASRLSRRVSLTRHLFQRINSVTNRRGILTFAFAALLTAYWYIPKNFNAAVLAEGIHLEMHLTFLIAGMLIYVGSTMLTKRMCQIVPVVAGKAMGLYGMFLLLTPLNIYSAYPIGQQSDAGVLLLLIMVIIDFTVVPVWLYNYFGRSASQPTFS